MAKIKAYNLINKSAVNDNDVFLIETDDGTKLIKAKDVILPFSIEKDILIAKYALLMCPFLVDTTGRIISYAPNNPAILNSSSFINQDKIKDKEYYAYLPEHTTKIEANTFKYPENLKRIFCVNTSDKMTIDNMYVAKATYNTSQSIISRVIDTLIGLSTDLNGKADAEKVYKIMYDRSFSDITSTLTTENAFYRYSDGKKIENQDTTSALIAVENTSEYYVTGKTAGLTALAVFFDESKNYISAYKYGTVATYTDELVVLPNNCKYVAFCSYKGVELAVKTTEYKSAFDKFEPLKGKSVYVDGDSIMYGYGSDGYAVGEMLRDNDGMSLTKAAVSGTTLAVQNSKNNSICERMTAITTDYDYIIFDGGINDLSNHNSGGDSAIQFGEMTQSYTSDFDTSTTLGALESICSHLVNNYPKSKKMFVCIHNVVTPSKNINTGQIALFDEIKKVLEKWGIPYVDINAKTNLKALSDTIRDTYFYKGDRVHPTLEAYKMFYYPVIKSALSEVTSAGAKGDKGIDGKTPIKGTDYFTEDDITSIVNAVYAKVADGTEVSY